MLEILKNVYNKLCGLFIKIIIESLFAHIYFNDYCLWHLAYRHFPSKVVDHIFRAVTCVQLYFLGARYLLKEVYRKMSPSVRKLAIAGEPDIPDNIRGFVVIVTGGSRGIGLSAAKDFYRRGAAVIVTSSVADEQERERMAKSFRDSVEPTVDGGHIAVWQIDFRDFGTVCNFAARFNKTYRQLDVLVNNAGVMFVEQQYTADGYEHHYQINYLSHALMTWLLMPALSASIVPARIVNVSSSTHFPRPAFLDDLQSVHTPYSPFHAYAQSKLCQIMLTYYMADWFESGAAAAADYSHILVNCLHPGVAKTELYVNVWWVKMFPALARLLFRTADEGAETVIYAALSGNVESSGHYLEDCDSILSSKFSRCKKAQAQLAAITRRQLSDIIEQYNRDHDFPDYYKMRPFLEQ